MGKSDLIQVRFVRIVERSKVHEWRGHYASKPGVAEQASTPKAEVGGSLRGQGQPGLHSEPSLHKIKEYETCSSGLGV